MEEYRNIFLKDDADHWKEEPSYFSLSFYFDVTQQN